MLKYLTKFKNHKGLKRYLKNTSWMLIERLLRIIAGLFVGIWVARYLGPEQFGLLSYILAFVGIFGGIAKLGLDTIVVRELVNNPQNSDIYIGTSFWLKVIGTIIVLCLLAFILPFTSNDSTTNLFILIIGIGLIFQSFEIVEFYFQSQVLAKFVSICKITQLLICSIIRINLVLMESELQYFVYLTIFEAFILGLCYFLAYKHKNGYLLPINKFSLLIASKLLKDSWPLIFSAIVIMIYMRIDQVMIKEMLGSYEVGIYSASVRLTEIFYFIPFIITSSLYPAILKAKQKSKELYNKRLQWLYTMLIWLAILISVIMMIGSELLVDLLFGDDFKDVAKVLSIHIWASIFVFIGTASGNWYVTENLQTLVMINSSVGATVNLILNLILIPEFGILGAAYATLISQSVAAYFMNCVWSKTRRNFAVISKCLFIKRSVN